MTLLAADFESGCNFSFHLLGREVGGQWESNNVSFFKFGKQNVHTDVLCLKDKTAFVCYNVTLVKISVDNEKQKQQQQQQKKPFVIILKMTKFKIQAIKA